MNIMYSDDLDEMVVINCSYLVTLADLRNIKLNGSGVIYGIEFYYRQLDTIGEIRMKWGKRNPLVAVYVDDCNQFLMFRSNTGVMSYIVK